MPGKSHRWWNMVGYSPWGCKETNTTQQLHFWLCRVVSLGPDRGKERMGWHVLSIRSSSKGMNWTPRYCTARSTLPGGSLLLQDLRRSTWIYLGETLGCPSASLLHNELDSYHLSHNYPQVCVFVCVCEREREREKDGYRYRYIQFAYICLLCFQHTSSHMRAIHGTDLKLK